MKNAELCGCENFKTHAMGRLGGSVVFIKVFLQGVDQFSNFPQVSSQFRNLRYYINQILKSVDI